MKDVLETMRSLISEQFGVEPDSITPETSFKDDLGADSVDLVELVMAMEEEFKIGEVREDELSSLATVGDCIAFLNQRTDS
jgi:acyl carrier protein